MIEHYIKFYYIITTDLVKLVLYITDGYALRASAIEQWHNTLGDLTEICG